MVAVHVLSLAPNLGLLMLWQEQSFSCSFTKGKNQIFSIFLNVFFRKYLAATNIAKKGEPLQKLARGDRQIHLGTFNFWVTSPKGTKPRIFVFFRFLGR